MYNLVELSIDDGVKIYEMLQKINSEENLFHNDVFGMTYSDYKDWLIKQSKWAIGSELPDGYVRQWIYWLYVDEVPVGFGKIREKLTAASRECGGNIGYAIAFDERGKGYGKILFEMLLNKARELRVNEIISTVEKSNPCSKHIQELCGGILFDENDYRWFFRF